VINALRGQISVEDAPGGGALFRVILPAATEEALLSTTASGVSSQAERSDRSRRVLIIDDDALVAKSLAARLAGDRFDVRTVIDARQGLNILLADEPFDLAYCDVMMKELTGIDLHKSLQKNAPQRLSKVVFMTGGAFTPEAQAFLSQRGEMHVEKPFDIVADACRRLGIGV
jgi:CheY-like chemotaxis protein